jgi:5-formyltetrahydrofolate cyclo-ligase
MSKQEQRRAMLTQLAAVGQAERRRTGERIARQLLDLPELGRARRLMLFLSMPDELDTDPLVELSLEAGLRVYAPRTLKKSHQLIPVRMTSLEAVVTGAYGIREPAGDETTEPEELDVIVVPGVAFDRALWRLGRGGGFYDRLLEGLPDDGARCGVAYSFQIVDEVKREPHDRPVDLVVTEEEVLQRR